MVNRSILNRDTKTVLAKQGYVYDHCDTNELYPLLIQSQQMMRPRLYILAGLIVATSLTIPLASCTPEKGGANHTSDGPESNADGSKEHRESPLLRERVRRGELPQLGERLPIDPVIEDSGQNPGQYVDVIRSLQLRNDKYYSTRLVYDAGLVAWSADHSRIVGVLAKDWNVSPDAREYTFQLRKGLRWSDGAPFTADDIEFAVNDVMKHPTLGLGFPVPWLTSATVEFIKFDDYSFGLKLDKPDGQLLTRCAGMTGKSLVLYQRMFSSQFHPDYQENAEADARGAGFGSVQEYFFAKCPHYYGNLDTESGRPTMNAWIITEGKRSASGKWRFERNPFYCKVDTQGNQLPYADYFDFYLVDSPEDRILRAMAGQVDVVYPFSPLDRPTLFKNQKRGGYRLVDVRYDGGPILVIGFNRTGPDQELASLAANKEFRIAASVAINRTEICNALYAGKGEPFQAAPLPDTPFYDQAFAKQYTAYAPDKANQILDRLGLNERNSDGIRLLPSGRPLAYTLLYYPRDAETSDILEFIQRYWREVGIRLNLRSVPENALEELMNSGKYNIAAITGPNNLYTYNPWAMVPIEPTSCIYASGWFGWFHNRLTGESVPFAEPDKATKNAIEAHIKMSQTVDSSEQDQYAREIIANAKEQFYLIGTFLAPPKTGLVLDEMVNVPDAFELSWQRGGPSNVLRPALWWTK
jgi:peptide/nickel transport system substrate-binding protein